MASEEGLLITSPSRDNIEPTVTDWSVRRSSRKTPPVTSPVKGTVSSFTYSPIPLPKHLQHCLLKEFCLLVRV